MKKILLSAVLLLTVSGMATAAQPLEDRDSQILLTIDNNPVTLGEFEYLYHKNNSQQMAPQTIDEYLQMFINYKLKVMEAEAASIDKTDNFKSELRGYARELAEPYLIDNTIEQQLIDQEYARMAEEVNVSHIMLMPGYSPLEHAAGKVRLDSIRNVILQGGDFEELAKRFSVDRASSVNGGNMGYITAGRFPYSFESAAYDTPVGELSQVVETQFGFHLVKPIGRRPARGEVLVQHVLKLTQGLDAERKKAVLHSMDSLHTLLANGADFDDIASRESEDPGSARQGGRLPWFSTGRMVKPFEDVAYALNDGDLSDVFETAYGYHIIKRLDSKALPSKEEATPQIRQMIENDERAQMPRRARLDELKARYGVVKNRPAYAMAESVIRSNGGYDSTVVARFMSMPAPMVTIGDDRKILLSQVVSRLQPMPDVQADVAYEMLVNRIDEMIDETVTDIALEKLPEENADYRNLLKEYRDGMLLFEISDRMVWTRAKEDTAGLNRWFETHRDRYTWTAPKFKSYIIFATSDSVLDVANRFLASNPIQGKDLAPALRQLCGRDVRVERVIAAKGENAIIDYLGFNGERPVPTGKWVSYVAYQPVIIDAPVEVADERGAITADYQAALEKEWIKKMQKSHKVKVNKKVLKQAR
ncbi:MAG: peptidylprolyl isomerase [Clostridiales bacterium]|nr:peptidylprolyl isomerase [Clostridiales bacterium]